MRKHVFFRDFKARGRMSNKIVAIVLCFILFAGSAVIAVEETSPIQKGVGSSNRNGFDFFVDIGVLKEEDAIYKKQESDGMTRAQFMKVAYAMYNGQATDATKNYFYDITPSTEGYVAINSLAEMSIVSGDGTGAFRPEDNITVYEALSVMLNIMGYHNIMHKNFAAYISDTCTQFDLLKRFEFVGVEPTAYNILDIVRKISSRPVMGLAGVENGVGSYKQTDDTILTKYFDIFFIEGTLENDGLVSLNALETANPSYISVETTRIHNPNRIWKDLLGMKVEAYYRSGSDKELVSILDSGKSECTTIYGNQIEDFKDDRYIYSTDKSMKKSPYLKSSSVTVVRDNELAMSISKTTMIPNEGTVKIIDNGSGNDYVVIIKDYFSIVVDKAYQNNNKYSFIGREGVGAITVDEEILPCNVKFSDGSTAKFTDIVSGQTISYVGKTTGGEFYPMEIVISNRKEKGSIDTYNIGERKILLGDVEYPISLYCPSQITATNTEVETYISFTGEIVLIDVIDTKNTKAFGYVIETKIAKNRETHEEGVQIRIYDELGRIYKYFCAEKVKIDGISYKSVPTISAQVTPLVGEVILFRIDDDGYINYIDGPEIFSTTINPSADNCLVKMGNETGSSYSSLIFKSAYNSFGGRIQVNNNSTIIVIPDSPINSWEDDFSITTTEYLVSDAYYIAQGYTTDVKSQICDFVVVKLPKKAIEVTSGIAVVKKISKVLCDDDEIRYSINIVNKEGEAKYTVKYDTLIDTPEGNFTSTADAVPTGIKVEAGDTIKFHVNKDGLVDSIVLCYDYSADKLYTSTTDFVKNYTATGRVINAIPYAISGSILSMTNATGYFAGKALSANDLEVCDLGRFDTFIEVTVDNGKVTAEKSTPNSIKAAKNYSTQYSNIVVYFYGSKSGVMVIYNKQ